MKRTFEPTLHQRIESATTGADLEHRAAAELEAAIARAAAVLNASHLYSVVANASHSMDSSKCAMTAHLVPVLRPERGKCINTRGS